MLNTKIKMDEDLILENCAKAIRAVEKGAVSPDRGCVISYKAGYKNALKDVIALFNHPEVKVTPEYLKKLRNNIKL